MSRKRHVAQVVEQRKKMFPKMVAYISWLDYHPDKMGVAGSSPAVTTKLFKASPPMGL